jgi:uncharacterized protein (TIGR02145 family)
LTTGEFVNRVYEVAGDATLDAVCWGQCTACNTEPVPGCLDPLACNFNGEATIDDGSCDLESCYGCLDESACNFDPAAGLEANDQCLYAGEGFDCEGNCYTCATTFAVDLSCLFIPEGSRVYVRTTLNHPFNQMELADLDGDFLYTGASISPEEAGAMGMIGGAPFAFYYEIAPPENYCGWGYPASERDIANMVYHHSGDSLFSCNFNSWSVADSRCGLIGVDHADMFGTEGSTCEDAQSENYWIQTLRFQLDMSNEEAWNGSSIMLYAIGYWFETEVFLEDVMNNGVLTGEFLAFSPPGGAGEYSYDNSWYGSSDPGFEWASDCEWRPFELTDDPLQILPVDCPTSCDGECAFVGCTDPEACNFKPTAEEDNGSCIYDCCPGPDCCGGGTYWDFEAQACVPTLSADLDLNGCVGAPDLLELLAQYGECSYIEPEWQCGDAVEYQGHEYTTVLIDDQCWFAENLQNAYLNTGGELFEIDNEEDWLFNFDNNYAGYCYPLFFDGFGPNFGKLYNIHAILSPYLCPVDWHVSTDVDWFSLETHLGMPVEALTTPDRALYEIGHDLKDDDLWNGTNDSGFGVVPAGEKSGHNGFAPQGYSASFLTTTQPGGFSSYVGRSFGEGGTVGRGYYFERGGYSVRCVKD